MRALEIVFLRACDCRCQVCPSARGDQTVAFAPAGASALLRWGREHLAREVLFRGGEPTLWPDLPWACGEARTAGFDDVAVRTNGLRLGEPGLAERLAGAGASRVVLSLRGGSPETHDAMTGVPGAFDRALTGGRTARAAGLELELDVLVTARSAPELPALVGHAVDLGAARVELSLVSLPGGAGEERADLMPGLDELLEPVQAACRAAETAGLPIRSAHLPACLLGPFHRLSAPAWTRGVVLVEPGERPRDVADMAPSQTRFLPPCAECEIAAHCPGVREDLIAIRGEPEVPCAPLPPSPEEPDGEALGWVEVGEERLHLEEEARRAGAGDLLTPELLDALLAPAVRRRRDVRPPIEHGLRLGTEAGPRCHVAVAYDDDEPATLAQDALELDETLGLLAPPALPVLRAALRTISADLVSGLGVGVDLGPDRPSSSAEAVLRLREGRSQAKARLLARLWPGRETEALPYGLDGLRRLGVALGMASERPSLELGFAAGALPQAEVEEILAGLSPALRRLAGARDEGDEGLRALVVLLRLRADGPVGRGVELRLDGPGREASLATLQAVAGEARLDLGPLHDLLRRRPARPTALALTGSTPALSADLRYVLSRHSAD